MTKVFLDMDGVLVDVVSGLWGLSGDLHWPYDALRGAESYNLADVAEGWDQLWLRAGKSWWASLPPHRDAFEILSVLEKRFGEESIWVCTQPLNLTEYTDPVKWDWSDARERCIAGKLQWLYRFMPRYTHRWVFVGEGKAHLASPNSLLVDDRQSHVNEFRAAGGKAFLVARPWNDLFVQENQNACDLRDFINKRYPRIKDGLADD